MAPARACGCVGVGQRSQGGRYENHTPSKSDARRPAIAAPFVSRIAQAQSWPTKSIRAIVPVSAGSTIDIISRIAFEPLSQQLGQSIVAENRGGAGGTIGAAAAARAEPDGYTLLINSSQHTVSPAV